MPLRMRLPKRFSLRVGLALLTAATLLCGYLGHRYRAARRVDRAIELLQEQWAEFWFTDESDETAYPFWRRIARRFSSRSIEEVDLTFGGGLDQKGVDALARLANLRRLRLPNDCDICIYDLSPLGRIRGLEEIEFLPVEALLLLPGSLL